MKRILISMLATSVLWPTLALPQTAAGDDIDLKSLQSVRIERGKLQIIDMYVVRTIPLSGNQRLEFRILQQKNVDSSHSCGTLAYRQVELVITQERQKGVFEPVSSIAVPGDKLGELVIIANYFAKFRDSWERMAQNKTKSFQYELDNGTIRLEGNRDTLSLQLIRNEANNRKAGMYATEDLKVITSFTDQLNAVQRFNASHKFDECL